MKTIGVIGGMSWESTALYYRALNEGVKAKLGGLHSARIAMISLDFDEIETLQMAGDWNAAGDMLAKAGTQLKAAGADFVILATNTMHIVADRIEEATGLPFLHIADATGRALQKRSIKTAGLLGTAFTMEKDFYRKRLEDRFGVEILVPDTYGRQQVHRIIYDELCKGQIKESSRQTYLNVINELAAGNAAAVILGCTEIGMLVKPEDTPLPLLDTTAIHAQAAVEMALS